MATEQAPFCVGLLANADLSAAQYRAVTLTNSSGTARVARSTQGDRAIGILQNDPDTAGHAATVAVAGISKAVAGASITAGAAVSVDSQGRVVAVASTVDFEIGIALKTASNAGEIIPVLLLPAGLQ